MALKDKKILLCKCEGSLPLDEKKLKKAFGVDTLETATQLCRNQLSQFETAISNDKEVIVACTQEVPIFMDILSEQKIPPQVKFVNIREKAGWSKEATKATPKIAALLAESIVEVSPAKSISMESQGELLIIGDSQVAIDTASKLSTRLNVTVFLTKALDVVPPAIDSYPIFVGKIRSARGHLGKFEVDVYDVYASDPSSRSVLELAGVPRSETTVCDLILDLRTESLFNSDHKRDGYFNPAPTDAVGVAMALFDLTDMVGSFEKPQYIEYDPTICAHSRSQIVGCSKCIDSCSTGAISPNGDHVSFDPYICAGCGDCAAVCPTGAASYQMSNVDGLLTRQRALLDTYLKAGGNKPILLIHDMEYGEELITTMARFGDGLPSNVIPFSVNSIAQVGLETVASAIAYGATQVKIIAGNKKYEELAGCRSVCDLANFIFDKMGYGETRVQIIDNTDPDIISENLYKDAELSQIPPASYLSEGDKRSILHMAFNHLNRNASIQQDVIKLPEGAPFGTIHVDTENCTLCLACVGSCPANALRDNEDKPQLKYLESACVQCGLCAKTCPENVITLEPRLELTGAARNLTIIKEEDPFECIECGKVFGTKSTIENMINKLEGHAMFADKSQLDRLRMCDDCRVVALSNSTEDPFTSKARPQPRTTQDYLQARNDKPKPNEIN